MMSSIYSFLKRFRRSTHLDPARDWFVLMTISTIALAGIIVWNAWAFDTVANGGIIGGSVTRVPQVFTSTSLDAIHTIFTSRSQEQAKYVTGTYRYADPSQ